ncbi:hypothetical protein lbkm_1345 [Lachnospiraceae bacterium KM106-2]|nr:hypothetical protein lbkm_1345 [Lachnospiraceae bacterium KM106-2]
MPHETENSEQKVEKMLKFKKMTLEDIPVVRKYLQGLDNPACEFSVGNNLLWDDEDKLEFALIRDHLIYRTVEEEEVRYDIPCFKSNFKDVLKLLQSDAKKLGKNAVFAYLSKKMAEQIKAAYPSDYEICCNRDHSDYIYNVEDMIGLKGKKYHKKKNHVNYFEKHYNFTYEKITKENLSECLKMKEEWMAEYDDGSDTIQIESNAINLALNHYEDFQFVGGLIRIDGVVRAFTVGERLTDDMFVTHFEKADESINGLYTIINQQFTEHELSNYKYVNREDDLGIEGLRQAKLSYHPVQIYDKYEAITVKRLDLEPSKSYILNLS